MHFPRNRGALILPFSVGLVPILQPSLPLQTSPPLLRRLQTPSLTDLHYKRFLGFMGGFKIGASILPVNYWTSKPQKNQLNLRFQQVALCFSQGRGIPREIKLLDAQRAGDFKSRLTC